MSGTKYTQEEINNDKKIKEYSCVSEAAKELGVNGGQIFRCIHGKGKTAYGYKWKKVENKNFLLKN